MRIVLLLTLFISQSLMASELKPFETDLCTYFPEGTQEQPRLWEECCVDHDFRYWFGGDRLDQQIADLELKRCVKLKANSFWANLMHTGVRAGHLSPIKSKYKWGWGWQKDRGFKPLSQDEKTIIVDKSQEIKLSDKKIHELLVRNNIIPTPF